MTFKEYLEHPALSRSNIVDILDSYATYEYYEENPKEETPPMTKGRMIHEFLLAPDLFEQNFKVVDIPTNKDGTPNKRSKDYKAVIETLDGKELITLGQWNIYKAMEKQLKDHKSINEMMYNPDNKYEQDCIFEAVLNEKSFPFPEKLAMIEDKKVPCKCRFDVINHKEKYCIDYKTTSSSIADNNEIEYTIRKFEYYLQDSFYSVAARREFGEMYKFYFVFQNTKPPYLCTIVQIDNDYSRFGIYKILQGLYIYRYFQEHPTEYKGYSNEIETINKPEFLV